uniref:Cysteine-rich receptor-like protein kinase 28 n=1 Tax=Aegilops tauschii TaxID=37682 RepID=M8C6B2_AEGTA
MDSTCFRLHQLEAITNNFSEDQIVGRGGRGDVYKAVLNGEEIAVKRLHSMQGLDDKDFRNELRKLNKIRHKNIIRLIGYCHDTHKKCMEYEGELVLASIQERLLCFEYMQGGSLEKHIGDESSVLDWTTCYKIIQGTCEGLNHLHNGQEKPIFHLDLKPSHILLDNNMTPKITYFGLATCVASTEEEYQTETMRGTFGYMPPEYIDKCIVSNKFDVFSLGSTIIAVMAGNMGYRRYVQVSPSPTKFIELVRKNIYIFHEHIRLLPILLVYFCTLSWCTVIIREINYPNFACRKRRPCIEHIVRELEELEADIKRITSQPPDESKDSILQMGSNPYHLQLQHLKDITDNFSDARRLGSGGFGVVYKGVLRNGNMVAVKKLVLSTLKSQKQFENEGDLLMTLNHPNIVRLLGYCYETELIYRPYEDKFVFAQDTKHLLCLEYMPNGSLDNYISGLGTLEDSVPRDIKPLIPHLW